jgi:hypothetical protein
VTVFCRERAARISEGGCYALRVELEWLLHKLLYTSAVTLHGVCLVSPGLHELICPQTRDEEALEHDRRNVRCRSPHEVHAADGTKEMYSELMAVLVPVYAESSGTPSRAEWTYR